MARRTGHYESEIRPAKEKRRARDYNNVIAAGLLLLTLGLVVGLVLILWANPSGKTRWVARYCSSYAPGQAFNPFVAQDLDLLRDALDLDDDYFEALEASSEDRLRNLATTEFGESEHLVFYFSLRGTVRPAGPGQDPQAYLVTTSERGVSEVPVVELLDVIDQIKAKSKLILFETGPEELTVWDLFPDQDMTSDEWSVVQKKTLFPYYLHQAIIAKSRPNTFFITSHRVFERSNILPQQQRSVFAHGLHEAIQKLRADEGSSVKIDIYDLYDHLCHSVASQTKYWRGSGPRYAQMPLLYDGNQPALVQQPASQERGLAAYRVAYLKSSGEETSSTENEKESDNKRAVANSGNSDSDGQENAYREVWRLVRELEKRTEEKPHSPIDCAPLEWAQFLTNLIEEDLNARPSSQSGRPTSSGYDVETLQRALKQLHHTFRTVRSQPPEEERIDLAENLLLQRVDTKSAGYLRSWRENYRPSKNDQGVPLQVNPTQLVTETIRVGKDRDFLFRIRFRLQAHDLWPQEALDRDRLLDRSLAQYAKRFEQSELATSPLAFEIGRRVNCLESYLRQEDDLFVDQLAPDAASEIDLPDERELVNLDLRAVRFERKVELRGATNRVEFSFDEAELGPAVGLQPNAFSQPFRWSNRNASVGERQDEYQKRLQLTLWSVHKLKTDEGRETYGVAPRRDWPLMEQGVQLTLGQTRKQLKAEAYSEAIEVTAVGKNILANELQLNIGSYDEQSIQVEKTRIDGNQPNTVRWRLTLTPLKTFSSTEETPPLEIPIEVVAPNHRESIHAADALWVTLPPADRFSILVDNTNWKSSRVRQALQREFRHSFAKPLPIAPLTTLKSTFKFSINNRNQIDKTVSVELYMLKGERGRISDLAGFAKSSFRELDDADALLLLASNTAIPLPAGATETVSLTPAKPVEKDDLEIAGPLLVRVTDQRGAAVSDSATNNSRSQPAEEWFVWMTLRRIKAGKLVVWENEHEPLAAMELHLTDQLIGFSEKPLTETLFVAGRVPDNALRSWQDWQWNMVLPKPGDNGRVSVASEPRAIGSDKPAVTFSLLDEKLRDGENFVETRGFEEVGGEQVPLTRWLLNEKDASPIFAIKVDKNNSEQFRAVPWALDKVLDEHSRAKPIEMGMEDRQVRYYMSAKDGKIQIWATSQDFTEQVTKVPVQQYIVHFGDEPMAVLEVLRAPKKESWARLSISPRQSFLLKDKGHINITAKVEIAHFPAKVAFFLDDKPIWEKSFASEVEWKRALERDESLRLPNKDFMKALEEEEKSYSFKVGVKDFFQEDFQQSDEQLITIEKAVPMESGDPANEEPKTVKLTITTNISDVGKIHSATINGVSIKKDRDKVTLDGQKVSYRFKPSSAKPLVFSNLPPGDYDIVLKVIRVVSMKPEATKTITIAGDKPEVTEEVNFEEKE